MCYAIIFFSSSCHRYRWKSYVVFIQQIYSLWKLFCSECFDLLHCLFSLFANAETALQPCNM